uniref:G-protein coupled receptors family 1 profile domain-containing protein n=1 Tax=Ditylenchus dipsaci TaxID=166011 RepID=A0A915DB40_9BILA
MANFAYRLSICGVRSRLLLNLLTMLMILTKRVYRLSAYTIMANVALADALVLIVAGIGCGVSVILYSSTTIDKLLLAWARLQDLGGINEGAAMEDYINVDEEVITDGTLSLEEIVEEGKKKTVSWRRVKALTLSKKKTIRKNQSFQALMLTAGVVSYAFLGINRCVAICFYGTKAKAFNRVSIAIISSIFTWLIGIFTACVGTFLNLCRRSIIFISISLLIHCLSVTIQWICSSLVLMKIRQVKKKISKNKLNQNSANRFRKQARLTFQFFYPSLFCTISSILYFAKPFVSRLLSDYHFIILHIIWLSNHFCNPFIYIYFNERMRHSYWELLSCAQLRFLVMRSKRQTGFKNRINVSRRSAGQHSLNQRPSRQSVRSAGSRSNGHFVRNSLQMQSRDFEQLCEFMMRVNPLYESSEGWRESSSDLKKRDARLPSH